MVHHRRLRKLQSVLPKTIIISKKYPGELFSYSLGSGALDYKSKNKLGPQQQSVSDPYMSLILVLAIFRNGRKYIS